MPSKLVRVELGDEGLPIRIFRDKSWRTCTNPVQLMDRAKAVCSIREQVFDRTEIRESNNPLTRVCEEVGFTTEHECERCGRRITWETFEMNEIRPKGAGGGKTGGEVRLENCEALCHQCHTGSPDSAHGNRRWQTAKLDPEGS